MSAEREQLGRLILLPAQPCGKSSLKGLNEWQQAAFPNKGSEGASRPAGGKKRGGRGPIQTEKEVALGILQVKGPQMKNI